MEQHSILIYILLAIVITNLIRVTPMVLIKGELHNRFVRSFLYYVPYLHCWRASLQHGSVWDFSQLQPSVALSSIY